MLRDPIQLIFVILLSITPAVAVEQALAAVTEQPIEASEPEMAATPIPAVTEPTAESDTDLDNQFAELSLEELMSIQVTSVAGVKEDWFQTPAAMYVITDEDVRRSGHQLLPEVLRLVPGATVSRINAHQWAVGFRGLDGLLANNLLVLMDGRQLYDPVFGGVFWEVHDMILADLERIEAVRGPGATLWGANAVNGVINITAKSAKDTQGWHLSGLTGTDFNGVAEARYGGQLNESTWYRFWGKYLDHEAYNFTDGSSAQDDWASFHGGFRLDHEADEGQELMLDLGVASSPHFGQTFGVTVPGPPPDGGGYTPVVNDGEYNAVHALARLSDEQADTGWSLQSYVDYIHLDAFGISGYERISFDTEWRHHFRWGDQSRHELVWGLHYRADIDDAKPGPESSLDPSSEDHHRVDAFLQDTWELVPDRWFFMLGSKLEYNTHTGVEVQPSARLWYTPDDNNTFWAAVSRPVRTPSRYEDDINVTVAQIDLGGGVIVPVNLLGNDDLDAEQLISVEAGYRARLRHDLTLDLATFFNHYEDLIDVDTATTTVANNNRANTFGGELMLTWRPCDQLRIETSYSYIQINVEQPSVTINESTPQHQGRVSLAWDVTKDLELNSAVYIISNEPYSPIGSYTRLDLGVTWRPRPNLEIAIWGQNLLDGEHPEEVDNVLNSGTTEIPRSVYIQAKLRF